ncbi:hypothetical protein ID866_7707 [Astraeus odoratus]|nr:hypothetical protein ID866_7707 [Astraeus odoratus]
MPLLTTLIDDKSPLIFYDNTWLPGTSADDTDADQYYLGTFQTNNQTNGQATFLFNGTEFSIYSAKRPGHGTYTVQVDTDNYPNNNGSSTDNEFMVSLFNISGLTQGTHNVSLINTGSTGQYIGIDLIVWQSEVGDANDELIVEMVQDTDPRFQYSNLAWSATPADANFFNNGTGQ